MLTYLLANWKQLAGVAVAAAVLGWLAHRPPEPAVHLAESEHAQATTQAKTDQTVQAGPVKVTRTEEDFAAATSHADEGVHGGTHQPSPASQSGQPILRRIVTVTEQGPTTTETHAEARATQTADRKLDLTVTPQARAGWALQVGLEDVLHGGQVRVAARRRLLGPFWAEVAALPRTRAVGVGLAAEW